MNRFGLIAIVLQLFLFPSFICAETFGDLELQQTLEKSFQNSNEIHARFDERFYWDESSNVRVSVKDQVVTLRGIVSNYEARNAFIKIAETTPGVKEVVAKIRVVPNARKVD